MSSHDQPTPTQRKAAALAYNGTGAPKVTAKGEDQVAEQILALGQEHWIPTIENPLLVDLLCQVELNQEIPESLYKTIAHLLVFAYSVGENIHIDAEPL